MSSEVWLTVDLDVTLIANGCYRRLTNRLKGFAKSKPKRLSRKFVEASGELEVLLHRRLRVTLDRRSHNSILREAAVDQDSRTRLLEAIPHRIRLTMTGWRGRKC